jgi:serine/threonine protein kinase
VSEEPLLGRRLTGLAPDSLVAGYRVESRIGAGGMAMVFRARDEALGRTVALKVLTPALADDREFRDRFIRESRAVAAVDHPHIIPVYAAGESGGVLYLAMRFVVGGDLRGVIRREGPLPGDRAVALLSPIASALDAAHAAGLVHRDVKPANILVGAGPGRSEYPYLSDFGLAKGMSSSTGLTGTGQFLGTPDYAAPEQISGRPARPQTDQYALAGVTFTTLTAELPFPRADSMAVLWAHVYDAPPLVTAHRPDLPATVDDVLVRALAKSPDDRFSSCSEFIEALRVALLSGGGDTVTRPGSARFTPIGETAEPGTSAGPGAAARRHGARITVIVGALVLLAGAINVGALLFNSSTGHSNPRAGTDSHAAATPTSTAGPPKTPSPERPRPSAEKSAPEPPASAVTVDVYNGGSAASLAGDVSQHLVAKGYKAGAVADATAQSQPVTAGTQVFYGAGASANAAKIARYFGATAQALSDLPAGRVEVLLGTDSTKVPAGLASATSS